MEFYILVGVLLSLAATGESCAGGGIEIDDGISTGQRKIIRQLEAELADICPTCEVELKRKLIQSQKCRSFMCNFEVGGMCNYKSAGKPGLPQALYDLFIANNPDFKGRGGVSTKTEEDEYDAASKGGDYAWEGDGSAYEQFGGKDVSSTVDKLGLTDAEARRAKAFLTGDTAAAGAAATGGASDLLKTGQQLLGALGRRRKKRQSSPIENAFAQQQLLARQNAQGGDSSSILKLEGLGIRVPIGAREAETVAGRLSNKGLIPSSSDAKPADSDVTWGVFNGRFGDPPNGITGAASGQYYATTWTKPGEMAVMQAYGDFGEIMYLFYDAYEATEDISLKMCCDTVDRCVVNTPYEETVGGAGERTGTATKRGEWRKQSGACPKGTKKVLFVCDNRGLNEGACGIDNIQLFNANGMNFCQGTNLLAGSNMGEAPKSVAQSAAGTRTESNTYEEEQQNKEVNALLQLLRGG